MSFHFSRQAKCIAYFGHLIYCRQELGNSQRTVFTSIQIAILLPINRISQTEYYFTISETCFII